jgi:hypothetical protein
MNIKQFATYAEINEQYARKLILSTKVAATLVQVKGDVKRWEISKEDADKYIAQKSDVRSRHDGRNKFNLYATLEELVAIRKAIAEVLPDYEVDELLIKTPTHVAR